jgi:hypothetical protein
MFAGHVRQVFLLLELQVMQAELHELQLLFVFPTGLTVLLRQLKQLPLFK